MERLGRRSTGAFWTMAVLATWLGMGGDARAGDTRAPVPAAAWREPLTRAEMALASGQTRQAERAWEEARRAAVKARMPHGLLEVGIAYLSIGEVARDRATAVARARQLFLDSLFLARERRDVDGIAAAGHAFASLGDCEVAERAHAVVVRMSPNHGDAPVCARGDLLR